MVCNTMDNQTAGGSPKAGAEVSSPSDLRSACQQSFPRDCLLVPRTSRPCAWSASFVCHDGLDAKLLQRLKTLFPVSVNGSPTFPCSDSSEPSACKIIMPIKQLSSLTATSTISLHVAGVAKAATHQSMPLPPEPRLLLHSRLADRAPPLRVGPGCPTQSRL